MGGVDFQHFMVNSEEAQTEGMWQLCEAGKLEGEEEDHCIDEYDLVYGTIAKNCNAFTLHAELDQCRGEVTWKFMGYGESATVYRIVGKKHERLLSKNMQLCLVCSLVSIASGKPGVT